MILIDLSGITHAMTVIAWKNTLEANEEPTGTSWHEEEEEAQTFEERFGLELRARILDTLLKVKQEFAKSDEEIVICIDSRKNWRKQVFAEYKANRKARREEDPIDWKLAFEIINDLTYHLGKDFFFKVIKWENEDVGCEADDIIGTLARYKAGREPITIISDDSDFYQLHDIPKLKQYNYRKVQKTWRHAAKSLKIGDDTFVTPAQYKLLKNPDGDRKDGGPNFLNDNDIWVADDDRKYKRLGGKTALKILEEDDKCIAKYGYVADIRKEDGFKRNEQMIDLDNVPQDIKDGIIEQYLKFEYTGSELYPILSF